jgi:MFS family permease
MSGGSAIGVVAVLAIAGSPSLPAFFVAWVLAGVSMSATLYPPSFAAVTGWAGTDERARVRSLTAVTLIAGFSSTLFAPLTAVLLADLGWRDTYLVLAAVLALTIPAHWFGLSVPWTPLAHHTRASGPGIREETPVSWRSLDFVLVTVALTLAGFTVFATIINLVPLLTQHGLTTTAAAVALGIGGAGQVAGRLLYGPVLAPTSVRVRTLIALGSVAVTTAALAVVDHPVVAVMGLSFIAGSARGIFTLIQATAVSDRWGIAGFGVRNGIVSGGVMAASAVAPWAGAVLAAGFDSHSLAFLALAGATVAAIALVAIVDARPRRRTASSAEERR